MQLANDCVQVRVQVPLSLMKRVEKLAKKRGYSIKHALATALAFSEIYQKFISEESKQSYFGNVFVTFPEE